MTVTKPLGFVMNPLERVNTSSDTSFALMLEGQRRGHPLIHIDPGAVGLDQNQTFVRGWKVTVTDRATDFFERIEEVRLPATDFAAIIIRTDPPFDQDYLNTTWLLSFAERSGVRVINRPDGIRNANEKLFALEFPDLCPRTWVARNRRDVRDFLEELGGHGVGKPLDGFGGFGVVRLRHDDSYLPAIVDLLTLEGKRPILIQEYLPEAIEGDKRLFVINGELKAALQRIPPEGDHRGNVHVGGKVVACDIDDRDRAIVAGMSSRLREMGLYFVGLDVIAGRLIEANVTSPTLIRELQRLDGTDLATTLFDELL